MEFLETRHVVAESDLAIAERTQDRFVRSQPIVEVESQAAGLVRRLERLS